MNTTPYFDIYTASAGSGKTFSLVCEYLGMALNTADDEKLKTRFRSILAITFTNKSANEMKQRILSTVLQLAQGQDPKGYGTPVAQHLHISPQELYRRARVVGTAILHNYSNFSISTIDSFVLSIVRTFAHDLNLSGNFEVELDTRYMQDYVADYLIAQIGTEGHDDLTRILTAYATEQMSQDKSANVKDSLLQIADHLFKEGVWEYLSVLEEYTLADFLQAYKAMRQQDAAYQQQCQAAARQALQCCEEQHLTQDDFRAKSRGVHVWLQKIADGTLVGKLNAEAIKVWDSGELTPSKATADLCARIEQVADSVFHALRTVVEGAALYHSRQAVYGNFYTVALLSEMRRILFEYFQENELISIAEASHRISEEVRCQPAPFLFERLGERYRHFLIDEFQDTSKEQWHNLLPLILNAVSAGHLSMVVGDAKQAIYRFRQGDVQQFISLPHVEPYADSVQAADYPLLEQPGISRKVSLNTNWRSRAEIVTFNNHFFQWWVSSFAPQAQLLRDIYIGDGEAEQPALYQYYKKEGGYVQVSFHRREAMYEEVFRIIQEQSRQGYDLCDITVLTSRNRELSNFSAYLTQQQVGGQPVRVSSSESLLLKHSVVIRLIHSVLRYLHNGAERIIQLEVLSNLHQLQRLPDNYAEGFLHSAATFHMEAYLQQQGYAFDSERLKRLSLYDCCEAVIRIFRLEETDASFQVSFLNFVARYCRSQRADLDSFLDHFAQKIDNLSSNATEDRHTVRLMTVHKAKGLESPVVIYLVPAERSRPRAQWVEVPDTVSPVRTGLVYLSKDTDTCFNAARDQEKRMQTIDDVNRHYVALTRPCDKLFVVCEPVAERDDKDNLELGFVKALQVYVRQSYSHGECTCMSPDSEAETVPLDVQETSKGKKTTRVQSDMDGKVYGFGHDTAPEPTAAPAEGDIETIQNISFPLWENRILIATAEHVWPSSSQQDSVLFGLYTHDFLSQIYTAADVPQRLSAYSAKQGLPPATVAQIQAMVERLVSAPETAHFFAPQAMVRTECALCYQGKELRPDRVVAFPDKTYVVDFKTGKPLPEHTHQVSQYCNAMQAMGYPGVEGVLVYLSATAVTVQSVPWQ